MKIKRIKPNSQNFNSKLNGLHFVEFIQNIHLIAYGKMPQKGHYNVLSPKIILVTLGSSSCPQPFLLFLYPSHKFSWRNSSWCKFLLKLTIGCNAVSPIWMGVCQSIVNVQSTCFLQVGGTSCVHVWTT
jgi:hypothetical protein